MELERLPGDLVARIRRRCPDVDLEAVAAGIGPWAKSPSGLFARRCDEAQKRQSGEAVSDGINAEGERREAFLDAAQRRDPNAFRCPSERQSVYLALMRWLWDQPFVPPPSATADWLAEHGSALPDRDRLVERLRVWPAGEPYPPIPDDDALAMIRAVDEPYASAAPWQRDLRRGEVRRRLWMTDVRPAKYRVTEAINAVARMLEPPTDEPPPPVVSQ